MHMHMHMHMHMPAGHGLAMGLTTLTPREPAALLYTPLAPAPARPPPSQARDASHPTPGELRGVQNQLSNFGDDRPISAVAFSPGSGLCATGSWSHMVKIWSVPDCKQVAALPSQ